MNYSLPVITVVTPSYNQSDYLEVAIKSVVNQNYPNLEYFVIDGCSTDGSQEIIKRYSNKITYWCSEKDGGQSSAISKGFNLSSGDILCWLNSDDAFFPGTLNKVGHFFKAYPEVDMVTGGVAFTDSKGYVKRCYEMQKSILWFAKRGLIPFAQQSTFFKREIYESVGGIRTDLHYLMDTDLIFKFVLGKACCWAMSGLYSFFRWHSEMKSLRRYGRKAEEYKILSNELRLKLEGSLKDRILLRLIKAFNGIYFRDFLYTVRLRGKNINEIWGW